MRIIHAFSNPALQLLIAHSPEPHLAIDAGLLRGTDDAAGDDDADVTDAGDGRVEAALVALGRCERGGEGGGGGVDHGLGDGGCFGEDGAEADAGEDVHVVACLSTLNGGWIGENGRGETDLGREFPIAHHGVERERDCR